MKKILRIAGLIVAILIAGFAIVLFFFTPRFNTGLAIGYYGDYNLAKKIIRQSECLRLLEDKNVHKDIVLESFSFTIHTKSGRKSNLTFVDGMDIRKVCEHPKGVLIYHPGKGFQVYNIEALSVILLEEKQYNVTNLGDILCHIDNIIPIFQANHDNETFPYVSRISNDYLEYLVIEYTLELSGSRTMKNW